MGSIIKKSTFSYETDGVIFHDPLIEPKYNHDNENSEFHYTDEIEANKSKQLKKIQELEETIDKLKQSHDELANSYRELKDNYEQKVSSEVTCLLEEKVLAIKDKLTLEAEQSINQLSKISNELINVFDRKFNLYEDDLKEMLFFSVLRILKKEYDDEYLLSVISESIDSYKSSKIVTISISPKDYKEHLRALKTIAGGENLQIQPDERVKLGGCIVRMEEKSIDKRLETQVDIFKNILLGVSCES